MASGRGGRCQQNSGAKCRDLKWTAQVGVGADLSVAGGVVISGAGSAAGQAAANQIDPEDASSVVEAGVLGAVGAAFANALNAFAGKAGRSAYTFAQLRYFGSMGGDPLYLGLSSGLVSLLPAIGRQPNLAHCSVNRR